MSRFFYSVLSFLCAADNSECSHFAAHIRKINVKIQFYVVSNNSQLKALYDLKWMPYSTRERPHNCFSERFGDDVEDKFLLTWKTQRAERGSGRGLVGGTERPQTRNRKKKLKLWRKMEKKVNDRHVVDFNLISRFKGSQWREV